MKVILPPITALLCFQQESFNTEKDLTLPPLRIPSNFFESSQEQDLSLNVNSTTFAQSFWPSVAKVQPASPPAIAAVPVPAPASPGSPGSPQAPASPTPISDSWISSAPVNRGERKAKNGCNCAGCRRKECKICRFCLDKKKFGGKQILRQRCEQRKCERKTKTCHGIEKPAKALGRAYESKFSLQMMNVVDGELKKTIIAQ